MHLSLASRGGGVDPKPFSKGIDDFVLGTIQQILSHCGGGNVGA